MNSRLFLAEANKLLPFTACQRPTAGPQSTIVHSSVAGIRIIMHILIDKGTAIGRGPLSERSSTSIVITTTLASESGCSTRKVTDFCSTPKVDAL
jgi:hypothetical protein